MTMYFLVAAGGAVGSIARFALGRSIEQKNRTEFPFGTFVVNILGAVLFGIFNAAAASDNAYILIGEGFFGAFTTFSTFMVEGFSLLRKKQKTRTLLYITSTILLGIVGYLLGGAFYYSF